MTPEGQQLYDAEAALLAARTRALADPSRGATRAVAAAQKRAERAAGAVIHTNCCPRCGTAVVWTLPLHDCPDRASYKESTAEASA